MVVALARTASGAFYQTVETPFGDDGLCHTAQVGHDPRRPTLGVLYVHGAAGNRRTFATSPGLRHQREILMDAGCVVAEIDGFGEAPRDNGLNWGRPYALTAYRQAMEMTEERYAITSWCVIGRSMGGVVGKQVLADPQARPRISAYIDNAGVFDLLTGWRTQANIERYLRNAWKVRSEEELFDLTAEHDPGRWDWSSIDLRHVQVRTLVGGADTVVLPVPQGRAFAERVRAATPRSRLHLYPERDHGGGRLGLGVAPDNLSFTRSIVPSAPRAPRAGAALASYTCDGVGGWRRAQTIGP